MHAMNGHEAIGLRALTGRTRTIRGAALAFALVVTSSALLTRA
jgi:hypothetical protein